MSRITFRPSRTTTTSPSDCAPIPPVCTSCGQLECLCRPRFFPGQVLSSDDLNRLDRYIRGKQKLHNRQLHGWGVVNGLEVSCEPCGKGVVVGAGYALSPCGEDIVVCEPVGVDVCKLIQDCLAAERHIQPCGPYQSPSVADCCADGSDWVLAIRYAETPSRGVRPLINKGGSCGCGCAPGACTCGARATSPPRGAPPQCEPTVICEGFSFEVFRKPSIDICNGDPGGGESPFSKLALDSELVRRMECCWEKLILGLPKPPAEFGSYEEARTYVCRLSDFLRRYLSSKPGTNCELLARLNAIGCPPADPNNLQALSATYQLLVAVYIDALLNCFCSALLPPVQAPHSDLRVPIATLRVAGDSCRILSICNWTHHRKLVMSFPTLNYWLGVLPFGTMLRCLLERICCFQISAPQETKPSYTAGSGLTVNPNYSVTPRAAMVSGMTGETSANAPAANPVSERIHRRLNPRVNEPQRAAGVAELLQGAWNRGGGDLDVNTFFGGILPDFSMFDPEVKDRQARDQLSEVERTNLPQFLMINQLLRPLAASALEPLLQGRGEERFSAAAKRSDDTEALRQEVAELKERLDLQAKQIEQLLANPGGNPS